MGQRIPIKCQAQLGELLATWYRRFGTVAPRQPYQEDDSSSGTSRSANKMFTEHPWLAEMPLGAPSDLTAIIVEDSRTLALVEERKEELAKELQYKWQFTLSPKLQARNRYQYNYPLKPRPL